MGRIAKGQVPKWPQRPPIRVRPCHLQRYLRVKGKRWEALMDRAGLGDYKHAQWLTRAQAKRVMKYHFVRLYEESLVPKRNFRYAPGTRDRSLRRSVHPRLQSLLPTQQEGD